MARTHIEVVDQDLEPYGQEQETLADVRRLINEQFRTLQGRLSDADLIQCTLRAARIKQLLEAIRLDCSGGTALPACKLTVDKKTQQIEIETYQNPWNLTNLMSSKK
jgi:hypothetical protein